MMEDGGAILRPRVPTLPILRGRVVHLVEELEQSAVGELRGVEGHLERFCIFCRYQQCPNCQLYKRGYIRPVRPEHTAR